MRHTLRRIGHVSARTALGGVCRVKEKITAHTGCEVDDHIDTGGADIAHRFAVKGGITRRLAGERVTHMQMYNGRACRMGFKRRIRNLARCDGNSRVLADRIASPSDRT